MKKIIYISFVLIGFSAACSKTNNDEDCIAVQNQNCICTMEYAPVCGCDDVTYSNSCSANCAGVEIVSEGECP